MNGFIDSLKRIFRQESDQNRKFGLALSGGSVLGAAHIGILRALEEHDVKIDYITGTSIGAFVAALYACGTSVSKIEEISLSLNWLEVSGLSVSKMGLLTNKKMGEYLDRHIGDVTFEDTRIPLAVMATDISKGEKVVLNSGDLSTAVIASACIPGLFIPVEMDGRLLVDGGLCENVPISPLKTMGADKIIAADLHAKRTYRQPDDLIDVIINSMDIALDNLTREQLKEVDLLIQPELSAFNRTDTGKMKEMIEAGYRSASKVLQQRH